MEKDFWLGRWKDNQIGFHQSNINPHLKKYMDRLAGTGPVFVPLCGKTLDLIYIGEKGRKALGVEFSEKACDAFFSENGIAHEKKEEGGFKFYDSVQTTLYCGDFFSLKPDHLSGAKCVFDRASMIALPPDMRKRYTGHLKNLIGKNGQILLVTMEYPQHEMSGPPFSVSEDEVRTLYAGDRIELLEEKDSLKENPNMKDRGLSSMKEKVYLITIES